LTQVESYCGYNRFIIAGLLKTFGNWRIGAVIEA